MPPYVTRGSWYSQLPAFGWWDNQDRSNSNALGVPDSQQGIALPSRRTLGQWFNVTPPGGGLPFPMQQTDVGPAARTGRGVDISAAAAHQMGYTPKDFPTDAGFKIEPRDEPRGLGSPAGMPVQAGDLPDNATGDAYASADIPARKRSMPSTLADMFQPRSLADNSPISMGDAFQQRSNSLVGLGMGLLQPYRPWAGESPYANAAQGYMQGAQADSAAAYRQAQLAHTKSQEARQAAQDAFNRQMAEKQFARSGETDFAKYAREQGLTPGSPEYIEGSRKWAQSKQEGDLSVVEVQHPQYPDMKVPKLFNKRTGAFTDIPSGGPATAAAGPTVNWSTGGTNAPVYGEGAGGYNTPAAGTAAAPAADQPRAFPPAPFGSSSKVWNEEQTKRAVKEQAEKERNLKQAGMIDPVKEDIAQAIKIIEANPKSTTGLYGSMASKFGGQAGDLAGLLTTIKGRISIDELQKMRQASPTGGAMGNVSDKDMAILQAVEGSVEQSRTPEQLKYNLERLDRMRHEVIHGPGTAPPAWFKPPDPGGGTRAGGAAVPKAKPGYIDPDFPDQVFKGGDPSDPNNWATINRSGR